MMAQRYVLEKPLASGGMGTIWVAKHLLLDVPVAVKFMSQEVDDTPFGRMRFEREAKAAARIASPHVARVYDYGVEDGTPYIAMELLVGESLEDRLRRDLALTTKEVSKILRQIQKGLSEAHALGIVHRDLKPANIFLARAGDEEVVKILDFGIAKDTSNLTVEDDRTKSGTVLGSPHHMSPEQARGGDIDTRSDLWSLGVVLFRSLTGERPFAGNNMGDIIAKICGDAIPKPSSFMSTLGPEIDGFFERALRRNPDLRFQSVREMSNAFEEAIGQEPVPESTRQAAPPALGHSVSEVVVPRADVTRDVAARTSIVDSEPTAIGTSSDKPIRVVRDRRPFGRYVLSALILTGVAGGVVLSWIHFGPHAKDQAAPTAASNSHPSGAADSSGPPIPSLSTNTVVSPSDAVDSPLPVGSASASIPDPQPSAKGNIHPVPWGHRKGAPPKSKGDPFF